MLDGLGRRARARVLGIGKRAIELEVEAVEQAAAPLPLDVAIAVPKREALESMVKMAVELGVRRLWLLRGDFSPERIPEFSRLVAIVKSALEQSNNPWSPQLHLLDGWGEIPWADYDRVLVFDPAGARGEDFAWLTTDGILTVIGPEGGFSERDRASWPTVSLVGLPTAILRAPTALATAWGWVLAKRVNSQRELT